MLTDKSLRNPRRRMPELKQIVFKLRTLKRSRYSHKLCSISFGGDDGKALLYFLDDTIKFLNCTFADHLDNKYISKKAIDSMIASIEHIKEEATVRILIRKPKGFSSKAIGSFTRSATTLYRVTRYTDINFDCDPIWVQLALVAQALFQESKPIKNKASVI